MDWHSKVWVGNFYLFIFIIIFGMSVMLSRGCMYKYSNIVKYYYNLKLI